MGIKGQGGRLPFSSQSQAKINNIFRAARVQYANIAAKTALEIFRAYVPIDTETLQDSIKASVRGDVAIIEVPNVTLDYGKRNVKAKALALILEIGLGHAGAMLHRSRSNQAPGTQEGDPTADWFQKALSNTRQQLDPIGQQLIQQAAKRAMSVLING